MSEDIYVIGNTLRISTECALDLYKAVKKFYLFDDPEDVTHKGLLNISDNARLKDNMLRDRDIQNVLKKHKVEGQVLFGIKDESPSLWGYNFDGQGGMQELKGEIKWTPKGLAPGANLKPSFKK